MGQKINAERTVAKKQERRNGRTETTTIGRSLRERAEKKRTCKARQKYERLMRKNGRVMQKGNIEEKHSGAEAGN